MGSPLLGAGNFDRDELDAFLMSVPRKTACTILAKVRGIHHDHRSRGTYLPVPPPAARYSASAFGINACSRSMREPGEG